MTEHPIDDLLAPLTGPVDPDPDFDARLRALLEAELDGSAGAEDAPETEEALELEAIADVPTTRWPSWRPFALAAAVLAIVAAAAIVTTRGDDGSTVVDVPPRTFVDAELLPVAIDEGTNPYFVGVGEHAWVLSLAGDLTRIDRLTGDVLGRTTVPESSPLVVDEHAVWVADAVDGDVLRLDPETGELVERIPTGVEVFDNTVRFPMLEGVSRQFSAIGGIASDGSMVWVGDRAGRVLRIDPETNEVVGSLDVSVRPDLVGVEGDLLLVANLVSGEAQVIDTDSGDAVITVPGTSDDLAGAALHGGALFLQDAGEGVVTRVDLETGATVTSESLGESLNRLSQPTLPTGLAVSDAGVLVDTANEPNSLHVLDAVTLEVLGTLAITADQGEMAIGPDGSAWLVRSAAREVVRIEPQPL
jgi:outer membrane protein assembly factor BamB